MVALLLSQNLLHVYQLFFLFDDRALMLFLSFLLAVFFFLVFVQGWSAYLNLLVKKRFLLLLFSQFGYLGQRLLNFLVILLDYLVGCIHVLSSLISTNIYRAPFYLPQLLVVRLDLSNLRKLHNLQQLIDFLLTVHQIDSHHLILLSLRMHFTLLLLLLFFLPNLRLFYVHLLFLDLPVLLILPDLVNGYPVLEHAQLILDILIEKRVFSVPFVQHQISVAFQHSVKIVDFNFHHFALFCELSLLKRQSTHDLLPTLDFHFYALDVLLVLAD